MHEFFKGFQPTDHKIPLKKITFGLTGKDLAVETLNYGTQTVIPDPNDKYEDVWEFLLRDTRLSFTATAVDDITDYKVSFFGSQQLSSTVLVKTSMVFVEDQEEFSFTATGSAHVKISEFSEMVKNYTKLTIPERFHAEDFTVDSVAFAGIDSYKHFPFKWLSIKLFGDTAKLAIVLYEKEELKPWIGFAAEFFSGISFQEVYPADIQQVPYFGSAIAEDLAFVKLFPGDELCSIPDGVFEDVLLFKSECITETDIKAIFDISITAFTFKNSVDGNELVSYPVNNALTLNEILKVYDSNIDLDKMNKRHEFFFDLRTVYNAGVEMITSPLNPGEEYKVCIDLIDNKETSFFYNLLVIANADIKFCLTHQNTLDVSLKGVLAIDNVNFTATVDKKGKVYTISASASTFHIDNVVAHFHARFFPREIRGALQESPFLRFRVKNPLFVHHISSLDQQVLEIGGTPIMGGYSRVDMDAILVHNKINELVVGIFIESVSLENLLHDLTQIIISPGIPMLDQQVAATVLISPTTMEGYRLKQHSQLPIQKGITVEAKIGLPGDCPFCRAARNILGQHTQFTLKGTMESAGSFSLSADNLVDSFDLGNQFILQRVGFDITVGGVNSIGVTGSLQIKNPSITLSAAIQPASGNGVEAKLRMAGCWKNSFGQDWLAICNIGGSVHIDANSPGLPSMMDIGGEVKLGNKACSTPLLANGYLGINAANPSDDYFHAEFITRARISSLLKAFCWEDVVLPRPLKESRFPVGFAASYSSNGKTIPKDTTISAGYHFKGILEIIGLPGHADINADFTNNKLSMKVELPPISFGNGLLEIYRSPDDHLNGPLLVAEISMNNVVSIVADGSMRLLGTTSVSTSLQITNQKYSFTLDTKLEKLYGASMEITALYSSNFYDALFQVAGSIPKDLKDAIESRITQVFQNAVSEAEREIKAAKGDLSSKQQILEDAKTSLTHNKNRVTDAYGEACAAEDAFIDSGKKVETAFARCRK